MLSLCAKDIMTRDVHTVSKGSSIEEVLNKMACNKISGLPVVDVEGKLVGIITESDVLLKGQISHFNKFAQPNAIFTPHADGLDEAYRRAQAVLVEEAMTSKVLTFMEESLVVDIARAMIEHAINRVPITNAGKVVGIVSRKDVIKALSNAASAGECANDHTRTGRLIEL